MITEDISTSSTTTTTTNIAKVLNNDLNLGGPRILQITNETQLDLEFGTTQFDVKITYYTNNVINGVSQYYSITSGLDNVIVGSDAVKVEFARSLPPSSMKFTYETENPTIGFAIFGTGPTNDNSTNYYYYALLDSSYMLGDYLIPSPLQNGNLVSTGLLAQIDPNNINPLFNISQPGDVGLMTATFSSYTVGIQIGYQATNSDNVGFFDYNLVLPPNLTALYAGDWSDNPLLAILGQLNDLGTINGNFSINVNHKTGDVNPYTLSSQETIIANTLISKGWNLIINGVTRIALETNYPPSTDINPVASFQNNTGATITIGISNNVGPIFASSMTISPGDSAEYIFRDVDTYTQLTMNSFDGNTRYVICGSTVISSTVGGTSDIGTDITLSSLQYALTNLSPGVVDYTISYTTDIAPTTTTSTTTTTTTSSSKSTAIHGLITNSASVSFDTLEYNKLDSLVNTSQGINVPISIAKTIIDFVIGIVKIGGSPNVNVTVGGYLIQQVTPEFAVVGCHIIKISDMTTIGKAAGWNGY